jgi:hypothetical protein
MAGVPRSGGADTNAKSSSIQTGSIKPGAGKKDAKSDAKSDQKQHHNTI